MSLDGYRSNNRLISALSLSFFLFLSTASICFASARPADSECSTQARQTTGGPRYPTGPTLPDLLGWTQPEYYSTLQSADVDGDGQNDLVARDKNGLHVWQYTRGAWVETSLLTDLSDSNGWSQPSHYSTIQFGRLQAGSQQADLIARASDGIHVWRYNASAHAWTQLGAAVGQRPFADPTAGTNSTDWTAPAYYKDIFVGDLNHDGVVELMGRGKNGLETYTWNEGSGTWYPMSNSGPLADESGSTSIPHFSPRVVTLSKTVSYLVAYQAGGIELLSERDGGWQTASAGGPFQSDGNASTSTVASIRTYVDGQGHLYLFGLTPDSTGENAHIAVYLWNDDARQWSRPSSIALPGSGWDKPSQYLTLRAGNFYGDGGTEITARGSNGMHLFRQSDRRGNTKWMQTQLLKDMRDAAGYSLASSYYTIQTLEMQSSETNQTGGTVLLGRSPLGVQIYHNVGGLLTQSTPFPTFSQTQAKAFSQLGLDVLQSSNPRGQYCIAVNNYNTWLTALDAMPIHKTAEDGIDQSDWDVAYNQLYTELTYVKAVSAWFQNNNTLMTFIFSDSQKDLDLVSGNMTLVASGGGANPSVVLYWTSFAFNIVSQITSVIPGAGTVTGLISDAFSIASTETSGGNNSLQLAVNQIETTLSNTSDNYVLESAKQYTAHVADWGLMQKLGVPSTDPNSPYVWGQATVLNMAQVQVKGRLGQQLSFYQTLSNPAWHVWHCNPGDPWYLCPANTSYPAKYIWYSPVGESPYQYTGNYTAYTTIHDGNNSQYPYFGGIDYLTETLGADINDVLTACNGWHTDDAALSSYQDPQDGVPGHCAPTSSALLVNTVPDTLAALRSLRERVHSDGPSSPKLTPPLEAAIQEIKRRSTWGSGYQQGQPSITDIKYEEAISPSRYVDKTEPIQFLQQFVAAVHLNEREGRLTQTLGDSYIAEAYTILGRINDDSVTIKLLGTPND